jgi:hypothetical protein
LRDLYFGTCRIILLHVSAHMAIFRYHVYKNVKKLLYAILNLITFIDM